jgi:hypothetical protein
MKKTPRWLYIMGCFGVVAIILAFPARTWLNSERSNLTDEQVREMLSRELPIGTDKSLVKRFLDAKPWPYSEIGQSLQSMIRDASHNILIRTDIQIRFFFDSNGKLVSYEIVDINTGP